MAADTERKHHPDKQALSRRIAGFERDGRLNLDTNAARRARVHLAHARSEWGHATRAAREVAEHILRVVEHDLGLVALNLEGAAEGRPEKK